MDKNSKIRCLEPGCTFSGVRVSQLRSHLKSEHDFFFEETQKDFEDFSEFQRWKEAVEKEEHAFFVKSSGVKRRKSVATHSYSCNRSGDFSSRGTGKRQLKSQGSSKMGYHCTAQMTASVSSSGHVSVTYYSRHYGHCHSLQHLPLQATDKIAVASKLKIGIQESEVVRQIREQSSSFGRDAFAVERSHLILLKDVANIKKSFGINAVEKHSRDAQSVALLIAELKATTDNPIILSKFQGSEEVLDGSSVTLTKENLEDLKDDYFILVIQTSHQKEMLRLFANDKVVCIDATHGTNQYGFYLITLFVIDDYGEGCPVAWCISNHESKIILRNFFLAVKQNCEEIKPCWFMSDDAPQYFDAWTSVFGSNAKKLLCKWHVDRSWTRNLKAIGDHEIEQKLYYELKTLAETQNIDEFDRLLQIFLNETKQNQKTAKFGKYFEENYAKRKEEWAVAYRIGSGISTNMYAEAFHRQIKYGASYLNGKVNRRLDRLVHYLLEFSKDKVFDRLIKRTKGKTKISRLQLIAGNHKRSLKSDVSTVEITESDCKWMVDSFEVVSNDSLNEPCCSVLCREGGVCCHQFSCACREYAVRCIMCVHIHLVCRAIGLRGSNVVQHPQSDYDLEAVADTLLETLPLYPKSPAEYKEKCKKELEQLHSVIDSCTSSNCLKDVASKLKSIARYVEMSSVNDFPVSANDEAPANKKISPQRPFHVGEKSIYKTMRRRRKPPSKYIHPTSKTQKTIIDWMLHGENSSSVPWNIDQTKVARKDTEALQYFCKKEAMTKFQKGSVFLTDDCIVDDVTDLPSNVLDIDEQEMLERLEKYASPEALAKIVKLVDDFKTSWTCSTCNSYKMDEKGMIQCDGPCQEWMHWNCAGKEIASADDSFYCAKCSAASPSKLIGNKPAVGSGKYALLHQTPKEKQRSIAAAVKKYGIQTHEEKQRQLAEDVHNGRLIPMPGCPPVPIPPPANLLKKDKKLKTKYPLEFLREQNRKRVEVVGDGNCLFRALSIQLFNSEGAYKALRALIVRCLRLHSEKYIAYWMPKEISSCDDFLKNHVDEMAKNRTWGTQVELHGVADLFATPVYVATPHAGNGVYEWCVFKPRTDHIANDVKIKLRSMINLQKTVGHVEILHNGCHYDSVASRNNAKLQIPHIYHEDIFIDIN